MTTTKTLPRQTVLRKLNKSLGEILPVNATFESVPMEEIMQAVRDNNAMIMQEDGAEWAGILIGRDSSATFEVKHPDFAKLFYMRLTWYKREGSGRYEITCYIS